MKLLRIVFITIICAYSSIFAENLESVTTTEDTENDVFIPLDENHPILNPNDNINDSSEFKSYTNGKITALNKITATSEEINFKVGEEKYFGNIKIKLHKCIKNLDPYNEDNYLLMTITEYKIDEDLIYSFKAGCPHQVFHSRLLNIQSMKFLLKIVFRCNI